VPECPVIGRETGQGFPRPDMSERVDMANQANPGIPHFISARTIEIYGIGAMKSTEPFYQPGPITIGRSLSRNY